jgi:ComF family protein
MVRAALDALLSVILAPACAACDALLEHPTHGSVCAACWSSILPLTPPLCGRCGDSLPTWRTDVIEGALCVRCRRVSPRFTHARAVGRYDGSLRAIVHSMKYEGRRSLARPLARLMALRGADVLSGADRVVPVPLHPGRRRERGFNQAADLAGYLETPVSHALRRSRATASQTGLPAAQRHRNVRGAFVPTSSARSLAGCVVVLIDDVSTTGATLNACAEALLTVGVSEVRALTAAKAVSSRRP